MVISDAGAELNFNESLSDTVSGGAMCFRCTRKVHITFSNICSSPICGMIRRGGRGGGRGGIVCIASHFRWTYLNNQCWHTYRISRSYWIQWHLFVLPLLQSFSSLSLQLWSQRVTAYNEAAVENYGVCACVSCMRSYASQMFFHINGLSFIIKHSTSCNYWFFSAVADIFTVTQVFSGCITFQKIMLGAMWATAEGAMYLGAHRIFVVFSGSQCHSSGWVELVKAVTPARSVAFSAHFSGEKLYCVCVCVLHTFYTWGSSGSDLVYVFVVLRTEFLLWLCQ